MKRIRVRKEKAETENEHKLMQRNDFTLLALLKEVVSPYWAARLVYQPARVPVLKGR